MSTESNPLSASTSQTSSSVAEETTSKESTSTTNPSLDIDQLVPKHPMSGLPFKMLADPSRGTSWDGVSPIIYTYPDGSIGTEPRIGATYELDHYRTETYKIYYDDFGRETGSICSDCSKKVGNKPNDVTCYKTSQTEYCNHCGVEIEFSVCHTCEEDAYKMGINPYCHNCGYPLSVGDKHHRFIEDMDCPDCGEWVKGYTCHVCD